MFLCFSQAVGQKTQTRVLNLIFKYCAFQEIKLKNWEGIKQEDLKIVVQTNNGGGQDQHNMLFTSLENLEEISQQKPIRTVRQMARLSRWSGSADT